MCLDLGFHRPVAGVPDNNTVAAMVAARSQIDGAFILDQCECADARLMTNQTSNPFPVEGLDDELAVLAATDDEPVIDYEPTQHNIHMAGFNTIDMPQRHILGPIGHEYLFGLADGEVPPRPSPGRHHCCIGYCLGPLGHLGQINSPQ